MWSLWEEEVSFPYFPLFVFCTSADSLSLPAPSSPLSAEPPSNRNSLPSTTPTTTNSSPTPSTNNATLLLLLAQSLLLPVPVPSPVPSTLRPSPPLQRPNNKLPPPPQRRRTTEVELSSPLGTTRTSDRQRNRPSRKPAVNLQPVRRFLPSLLPLRNTPRTTITTPLIRMGTMDRRMENRDIRTRVTARITTMGLLLPLRRGRTRVRR
jgi:hypothetical protein